MVRVAIETVVLTDKSEVFNLHITGDCVHFISAADRDAFMEDLAKLMMKHTNDDIEVRYLTTI